MRYRNIAFVTGVVLATLAVIVIGHSFMNQERFSAYKKNRLVPVIKSLDEFKQHVEPSPRAVIKFHADWCPSCRTTEKMYAQIADKLGKHFDFFVIDVNDPSPMADITQRYNVSGVPSFLFLSNGDEENSDKRVVGEVDQELLEKAILEAFGPIKKR